MSMTVNAVSTPVVATPVVSAPIAAQSAPMINISSGSQINSAADDPAGLAISEEMLTQMKGLDQGTENTQQMQDLVNTAEGGLSGISENLQRIRELGVRASSGIMNSDDLAIIQMEMDMIGQGINDVAKNTQYNGMNLLDGSFQNKNTASGADGKGMQISIDAMDMKSLGVDKLNVTKGKFDFDAIDKALDTVNSARADLGTSSNVMSYTINSNQITSLNQAAARSRIADADIGKESMELNKGRLLQQYQIAMQEKRMDNKRNEVSSIMGM